MVSHHIFDLQVSNNTSLASYSVKMRMRRMKEKKKRKKRRRKKGQVEEVKDEE